MSAIIASLIAASVIALLCGLFCHFFIKDLRKANLVGVLYTVLVFNGLSYAAAGSMDPYWYISSLIVAAVAFPVVLLVGSFMKERRKDET